MSHPADAERTTAQLLRLIAINAYAAWSNTLVGNPAPKIREQFERTKKPQPGDLVLETSTIWHWASHYDHAASNQFPHSGFPALGVLLRVVQEPVASADDLAKMHAEGDYYVKADETLDEIPKETVYYLRPLDGSVPEFRWTNASFIRVFDSLESLR